MFDTYQRILTRYAIERLLFRLSQTDAANLYVLKGAMLFVTWPQHIFRPSGDVDLLGQGDPITEAIRELFTRICMVECLASGPILPSVEWLSLTRSRHRISEAQPCRRRTLERDVISLNRRGIPESGGF